MSGSAPTRSARVEWNDQSAYECEICLEDPVEPVVTFCGHLYCWPCLYRWLKSGHAACPVCKSGVTQESVIPLYGRGKERVDPRTGTRAGDGAPQAIGAAAGAPSAGPVGGDEDVPTRPPGQRSVPVPPAEAWPAQGGPHIQFAAGFGFFPSLFGLQFQAVHTGRAGPIDPNQLFLDRIMLLLGAVVLFFLLFL